MEFKSSMSYRFLMQLWIDVNTESAQLLLSSAGSLRTYFTTNTKLRCENDGLQGKEKLLAIPRILLPVYICLCIASDQMNFVSFHPSDPPLPLPSLSPSLPPSLPIAH